MHAETLNNFGSTLQIAMDSEHDVYSNMASCILLGIFRQFSRIFTTYERC
jgi:hypothetical protein